MFGFGVATGYGRMAEGWEFGSRYCTKNFLFVTLSRLDFGPNHPPIQLVPGGSFLGCKAAGA
jgi:hypothetical protein